MGTITLTNTLTNGTTADADEVMENLEDIQNECNGSLDGDNIDSTAALSVASLSLSGNLSVTGTQTYTGSATFNGGIIGTPETYTPAASATATLNLALGNEHRITMPAGNITIAISNETNGQKFIISILQDGTGSRTVTWFSTIKWADGTTPTLTTTASKRDVFGFIVTGTDTYDGFIIGQNV